VEEAQALVCEAAALLALERHGDELPAPIC
jgi:hypothetical protein